MKKLVFLMISISFSSFAFADDLSCLPCNNGLQVCLKDPTDMSTAFQRKCGGVKCTDCVPSGFGRSRFSYSIFDGNNNFVWLGFSSFYTSYNQCERDRHADSRCR